MKDKGVSQLRAGVVRFCFGRFLEAMLAALVVLVALVASAMAQTPQTAAPIQRTHTARGPFRAARLTYLTGNVVVEQASSRAQDVAVVNMPLVEGTALNTGDDGQAEIEFEDGSVVRVTPNSGISLLNLSVDKDGNYQTRISVLGGLVYAELRAGTKYQYSIDAGGNVVSPAENSIVRVNLDEPPAQFAVLQGEVHLASVNGPSTVDAQAGQTARPDPQQADPAQQGPPFLVTEEIAPETWDQWNADRDQAALSESGTQTAARDQYAGDQGYGWSDLDASGSWYNVPGQGEVWQPSEADGSGADQSGQDAAQDAGQGFDPYGYGSWVYTPAGYSWASGYNWGWLPYRCGHWVYFDGFGWGWQPSISCGAFGFGGNGFGAYGYGVNVGRAPGFWHHPTRPVPGPGPVHPIIHGPVANLPLAVARTYGDGRLVSIKTVAGRSIEPLPPISGASALRGGEAVGSALRRDYPVSTATHEAALGIMPTHTAPSPSTYGRTDWQSGQGYGSGSYGSGANGSGARQPQPGRSTVVPEWPNYGNQPRPAPAPRPQPAPAPRQSAPAPAASHSAPAASSSSPHK